MMHGREKSDSLIVPEKLANKARYGGRAGGGKEGGQGEHEPAKHVPDAEPGKRVTGAGPQGSWAGGHPRPYRDQN